MRKTTCLERLSSILDLQKNHAYCQVSNRQGCRIVGVVGKISKTDSWGRVGEGGVLEKTESSNSQSGWLLNCFFLSFSNHKNYSIKNICVYSKSKIKTKVTNKQNLEHFRIINRKLFIPKFCDNSKMLLSSSWAIFIRALVFSFSTRVNFSSFEYLRFLFY